MPASRRKDWSGRPDLNRGPPAPKAGALPGCATPRHLYGIDSTALLVLLRLIQSWTVHESVQNSSKISSLCTKQWRSKLLKMNSGRILGSGAPCLKSRRALFADNSKHSIGSSALMPAGPVSACQGGQGNEKKDEL